MKGEAWRGVYYLAENREWQKGGRDERSFRPVFSLAAGNSGLWRRSRP